MQGDGGQKVSTPKQLAVALINTSVSNTTVLLVKPNFQAPYYAAAIPTVVGISEFYAAQYVTSAGKQQVQFYNCLGQKTPSACVSIPLCHDGVFARLDELQLQKVIRLSELPLVGTIRGVYQRIDRKSEPPKAAGYKHARPEGD